jgi:UDP-N-acetylmuramate--alanine ligase
MELLFRKELSIKKRAEVLGIITRIPFVLQLLEPTKTTTSSILGHIYTNGVDVTAFIGGIVENYNSNLIGKGKTVVVEADEFDEAFAFTPKYCLYNLDGCGSFRYLWHERCNRGVFNEFANKIADKAKLFITNDLPLEG